MKEPSQHQLDDSALPPFTSAPDLNAEQREALAKVYRLLLTLRDERTMVNESKSRTSPEQVIDTEPLVTPTTELLDE